ncbi:MAG TPA: hypothetical protein VKG86_04680 [Terracidiphilus sp.]|nr:hypothetical protein [Terracidiphilus sp.]
MLNSFTVAGFLAAGVIALLGIYFYLSLGRRETLTPPNSRPPDQGNSRISEPPAATEPEQIPSEPIRPYAKPKILLIDLDAEACPALTEVGYAAVEGSFGRYTKFPLERASVKWSGTLGSPA